MYSEDGVGPGPALDRAASDPGRLPAGLWHRQAGLERMVCDRTVGLAVVHARLQAEISQRRWLEARLLEAGEDQRRQIGQDLHDGLCQHLMGLAHLWNATCHRLADAVPEQAGNLRRIVDLMQQAVDQAHHLAHGLSRVRGDADGLLEALRTLIADFQTMYTVKLGLVCHRPWRIEDETTATHLYRIAQEALSNALRHGHCSEVTVELSADTEARRMRIRDNGRGLSGTSATSTGLGFETMRSRARAIGAQLTIQGRKPRGLEVSVTLPPISPTPKPL